MALAAVGNVVLNVVMVLLSVSNTLIVLSVGLPPPPNKYTFFPTAAAAMAHAAFGNVVLNVVMVLLSVSNTLIVLRYASPLLYPPNKYTFFPTAAAAMRCAAVGNAPTCPSKSSLLPPSTFETTCTASGSLVFIHNLLVSVGSVSPYAMLNSALPPLSVSGTFTSFALITKSSVKPKSEPSAL